MLQRILDWVDEAANGLIRLTYLLAGVTAVAVYFGAGNIPPQVEGVLNNALPWLLAFSVETQAYISSRRLAKAYNTLQAPALEDYQKVQAKREMRTQVTILAALMAFSVWNQFNYLASTWHPTSFTGLPVWADYLIRAMAAPCFFMAAAFLTPQAPTIGEAMDQESHKTLRQFLLVLAKQRKTALSKLKERTVDMGDAIQAVADAAHERKAGQMIATVQSALVRLSEGATVKEAETIALAETTATSKNETAEQRSRRVWKEGMTPKTLATKAGVSERTARRHIRTFRHELMGDTNVRLLAQRREA